MMTRARTAAVRKIKLVDIILHNLTTDETMKVGEADNYDQAIALAKRSGQVPKGWNVAISEANDERIIVVCKKGPIATGEGVRPAVTPAKAKESRSPGEVSWKESRSSICSKNSSPRSPRDNQCSTGTAHDQKMYSTRN
jgi:hypothetical protein